MKTPRILLKRGTEKQALDKKGVLELGEIAYLSDKRQMIIGNPASETGFDVVSTVVLGPHDSNFYARLEGQEKYTAIGLFVPLGLVKNTWKDSL